MKYRLMDILACPICKKFPLELIVFDETKSRYKPKEWKCEEYCGFSKEFVSKLEKLNCEECLSREIAEGILYCSNCNRWYPIIEEIPQMLPDELRDKNKDLSFLSKWKDKTPLKIVEGGKPYNLIG
jgi:uncharacterized protein YbaR (Trm112 family)